MLTVKEEDIPPPVRCHLYSPIRQHQRTELDRFRYETDSFEPRNFLGVSSPYSVQRGQLLTLSERCTFDRRAIHACVAHLSSHLTELMMMSDLLWVSEAPTQVLKRPGFHRRSHKKSRRGCLTCKERRVKVSKKWPTSNDVLMCLSATRHNLYAGTVAPEPQPASMQAGWWRQCMGCHPPQARTKQLTQGQRRQLRHLRHVLTLSTTR